MSGPDLDPGPDLAVTEGVEAECMHAYVSGIPPVAARSLDPSTTRIAGGVALSVPHDPTRYWSKAAGFTRPPTRAEVVSIVDWWRWRGDPSGTLQIPAATLPPDWPDVTAELGLSAGSTVLKLTCPVEEFHPGPASGRASGLRVAPVRPEDAHAWATAVVQGFGMPENGVVDMLAASAEHPAFHPFAVWDGPRVVAGANLFVTGEVASLNAASTLPSHRKRGAQTALVAARAALAAELGVKLLVVEAGRPEVPGANPSLNNLLAAGFTVRYERQQWIWPSSS